MTVIHVDFKSRTKSRTKGGITVDQAIDIFYRYFFGRMKTTDIAKSMGIQRHICKAVLYGVLWPEARKACSRFIDIRDGMIFR